MVKLFYTGQSCGAASFLSAFKAGIKLECEQVDLQTHLTKSGQDFYSINKNGNVPTLLLDDGTILNENSAVLQWIADQNPASMLAPPNGTTGRYVLQNWLSFIGTEIHQGVGRLFRPGSDEITSANLQIAKQRLVKLENKLQPLLQGGKKFLMGDSFTVADAYLYIVLSWFPHLKLSFDEFPSCASYFKGIGALDFVKEAHTRMSSSPNTTIDV